METMAEKQLAEWRKAYRDKADLMKERGFVEVTPFEFYRDLFPVGSLQADNDDKGKGNIIASKIRLEGRGKTRQFVVQDDLKMLERVIGDQFGLIAPISFYGKTHSKKNAHQLFAIAIDIDYVGLQQLKNQLKQFGYGKDAIANGTAGKGPSIQLAPTYLVSSGKGLHLYYFLTEPIELYHNLAEMLRELKEAMIRRLWNDTSSLRPDRPDITGIYQAFRCVGSQSKLGPEYPVRAWRISGKRYTLEDIKRAVPGCTVDVSAVYKKPKPGKAKRSKLSLEDAKTMYPEWYERKIVQGNPNSQKWTCKVALYEWWKRKIQYDVKEGGRFFSLMALCAYGLKCGIPEATIRKDAYGLLKFLDGLTEDQGNHFTRRDVNDALKALQAEKKDLTQLSTREWIEKHTKVDIPPSHRGKGKRLPQKEHLELARASRDIRQRIAGTKWTDNNGRPSKEQIVKKWRAEHPDGRKIDCERETGLSRPTVLKWWNA